MTTEAKFSFTTKVNGDLLTVRGDTAEEINRNIEEALRGDVCASVTALQLVAGGQATHVASTPAAPATPPAGTPPWEYPAPAAPAANTGAVPAPAAAAAPSGPPVPNCSHGPRVYKSGTSKAGKPWAGYMCGGDRNAPDKCEPVWA